MHYEIIMSGFSNQGIMAMGQLLAYAGMVENKQVSCLPSYGFEMRGGTANCTVILSDERIGSPLADEPYVVIAMNRPALDKFEPMLKKGGILIYNAPSINRNPYREDVEAIPVCASAVSSGMETKDIAHMVIMGALLERTKVVSEDSVLEALKKMQSSNENNVLEINKRALKKGKDMVVK